jgi:hypothetical protein
MKKKIFPIETPKKQEVSSERKVEVMLSKLVDIQASEHVHNESSEPVDSPARGLVQIESSELDHKRPNYRVKKVR